MNYKLANISNIINHINSVKQGTYRKKGICVFLGAGADISSGGLLFRQLKLLFIKESGVEIPANITDKLLDTIFEDQVDKMTQDSRCETLEHIMQQYKTPSEGYSLLVMLAELGIIDSVITTNFDYLLESTQTLLNTKPFTIFSPSKSIPEEYYYLHRQKSEPLYLKMHGDLNDRLVTHLTKSEIQSKQYGDQFIKLFSHIIQNNSLIIVGYGGYDSLITDIFRQEMDRIDEVYWCNTSEPQEDSDLIKELENSNKLSYINITFDKLFQELSKSLLKNVWLKNTAPIFLPTVVQCKRDNQILLFNEKNKKNYRLVHRMDAEKILDSFLASYDNKCVAIIGDAKLGKTCFILKTMQTMQDITFFPIACNSRYSILENMAQAVGYDTDMPFPIMYSFLQWWNQRGKHLVFVIDDFFNTSYFYENTESKIIDFFNFLYIVKEFKYIQFIISFQSKVFEELERKNIFKIFENIISEKIHIGNFKENEVVELLCQQAVDNIDFFRQMEILYSPYVWEIINDNDIILTIDGNFFDQYIDIIYNLSIDKFNFTKHALNTLLKGLAFKQIFGAGLIVNKDSEEYLFLQEQEIISKDGEIIYPELARYCCEQFFLQSKPWEEVISINIIPDLQNRHSITNSQLEVYVRILADIKHIDQYGVLLKQLDALINIQTDIFLVKIIVEVLQKCIKNNQEQFVNYLRSIDINIYSYKLQCYLFKVCAQKCLGNLDIWNEASNDSKLLFSSFVLQNDILYKSLRMCFEDNNLKRDVLNIFRASNGALRVCHLLTYWGWDNLCEKDYFQFMQFMSNEILSIIEINNFTIRTTAHTLIKYSYNIFFNAGEDFEEQFISCRTDLICCMIQDVLENKFLTKESYEQLLQINQNINNSWLFVVSNIIVVQAMRCHPNETYDMLYHFWDDVQFDILAEHLDFFLSSVFWSLYINSPCNRQKFVAIFENVVQKYERTLFMFPSTNRVASFHKFSEEFDRMFEDGFNPLAFYFYTAPFESLTREKNWDSGRDDLKIYWDLTNQMSDLGKYDDMLRIIHALGQMISIYPEKGYSALENMVGFEQPILKRGVIRIFKENYLRYSDITRAELEKSIYHFTPNDIEEILYSPDFLVENRTMEQLHWGRLFYNLEQLTNTNVSETFLSNVLQTQSCSEFLCGFLKIIF